jgi:5-methylcytosine-specific restriction enzyme A
MPRDNWQHLYNTARWVRLRRAHLNAEPLCRMCKAQGYVTLGNVSDHIEAHKGDLSLFFDGANLQTLCKGHHDSTKAREERGGIIVGCDKDGVPLDPGHHWSTGGGD